MSTVCIRKKKIPIFAINKRRTDRPSFIIFATLLHYEVLNFKRYLRSPRMLRSLIFESHSLYRPQEHHRFLNTFFSAQ